MRNLIITLAVLLVASVALADGPDGKTVSATVAGTAVVMQSPLLPTQQRTVYATCTTDGFTMSAWRYTPSTSSWRWVNFGSGVSSPDTVHAVANFILPIVGKFDLLFFKADTGPASIDLQLYTE